MYKCKVEIEKNCIYCKNKFLDRSPEKLRLYCSVNCKSYDWKMNNPEKVKETNKKFIGYHREYNAKWFFENKTRLREKVLKKKFNLTLEEYNEMFNKQNGCCAICGKHQSILNRGLSVDHCHKTCLIRGLLCQKCNYGLGMFEDSVGSLSKAIDYLQTVTV